MAGYLPPADPARHYDSVTPAWNIILGDDFHHGLFDGQDTDLAHATENLTRTLAAAAESPPGARIVDLGCGTGAPACSLAQHYGAASVVGISSSPVGVAMARQRSAALGLSEVVRFVCGDALASGLPDGAFDVAWLLESSQYLGPRPHVMSECLRLLAPAGRLAVSDVMLTRPLELRDLRRLHPELNALRDAFGDAVMGTPQEYRQAANMVGFEFTREIDLTDRVLSTFGCWRDRADRADRARVIALIGEAGLAEFIAGCDVMERFFAAGLLRYSLIVARKPSADG